MIRVSKYEDINNLLWVCKDKDGAIIPDEDCLGLIRYVYETIHAVHGHCELVADPVKNGYFWISETMKECLSDEDIVSLRESVNALQCLKRQGFLRKTTMWKSFKEGTNKGLQAEDIFRNNVNNDEEYRHSLSQHLGLHDGIHVISAEKVTKKNGHILKHSEQWSVLKTGTRETSPTSKADVCLKLSDDSQVFLSLKYKEGRITSADCYETTAILMSVYSVYKAQLDEQANITLAKILTELCESLKAFRKFRKVPKGYGYDTLNKGRKILETNPEFSEVYKWIDEYEVVKVKANNLWSQLRESYPHYIREVVRECLSGHLKFSQGKGIAERMCILADDHTIQTIINIQAHNQPLENFITETLEKKSGKRPFACKSAKSTLWIRMF